MIAGPHISVGKPARICSEAPWVSLTKENNGFSFLTVGNVPDMTVKSHDYTENVPLENVKNIRFFNEDSIFIEIIFLFLLSAETRRLLKKTFVTFSMQRVLTGKAS